MYYSNSDVRLEEQDIPGIGKGELLVKVMASGICGSDVMEWYRIKKAPKVLGHEISGEVVEAGKGIEKFKKGDRVFVTHHVPCNGCRYCKTGKHTACETLHSTTFYPGGFAQFVRVPAVNLEAGVIKLPKKMDFEEGSFVEPLGCVIRAQKKVGINKGDVVAVLGSGMSGLLHMRLAKVYGAGKVIATDISDFKLGMAKKFGADEVINAGENVPEKIKEINNGRGADLVILCAGAVSAAKQALASVDKGGNVIFFAPTGPGVELPVNICDLWLKGVSIFTSYAAVNEELAEAIELIENGKVNVKKMITHRLPLEETGKGFELVAKGEGSIKVIIEPNRE